jgi:large subunit ribosomal protein L25
MASDRAQLKVSERSEFGSRTARRLRREGLVPGVVYAGGSEARAFSVAERDARNALAEGGALLDLTFDGDTAEPVVVKEQQRHPVRGQLIHLDLQVVRLDQAIQSEVTIELLGTEDAPGVTEGGVLEHITHQVTVEALPTAIPESIPVDVSGMNIGDTLQLDSVIAPEGVEFVLGEGVVAEEVTIATLSPPRVEEEPEPEVEEEAELVGEDGEPIEAPEGEEAEGAEGEAEAGDGGGGGGEADSE